MKSSAAEASLAELNYEEARDELVEVLRTLETGTATLEESLNLWERGEALAAHCRQWLEGAMKRLDDAVNSPDDAPPTQASTNSDSLP